jgi:Flp pilus assembly protein TadG
MIAITRRGRRLRDASGQSLLEFAMTLPFLLVAGLGVIDVGYLLFDQHVVTKLSREGANLISRSASLQDAAAALQSMNTPPVDFSNGSKVILSVLKRGASTGTANYDKTILYERYEFGALPKQSKLTTAGTGTFGGPPDYVAVNSDSNTALQVTNLPTNIIAARGGLIYVAEIYSTHEALTPLSSFGVQLPTTLYSIAYF